MRARFVRMYHVARLEKLANLGVGCAARAGYCRHGGALLSQTSWYLPRSYLLHVYLLCVYARGRTDGRIAFVV